MANVSVIGAGYVGLVTGACLAELGHKVSVVEIDHGRLSTLQQGDLPVYEPGLTDLVAGHRKSGSIKFTGDYGEAIPEAQFVFIAVGTPILPDGQADTSAVFAAVNSILEHAPLDLTIIIKSTVSVGTGDEAAEWVAQSGRPDVHLVSNPEFLREGSAIRDFMKPDRIVIGANDPQSAAAVSHLYDGVDAPTIMSSRCSAELGKYAANGFLSTRISLINEVSTICEVVGADIEEVKGIIGSDRRIGPDFLNAGLGWGGSCFPKDLRSLAATADKYGCAPSILRAVDHVNANQRMRALDRVLSAVGEVDHPVVTVIGLAFKPHTDDVRESPGIDIARWLLEKGICVQAHDPVAMVGANRILPNISLCDDPYEAAEGSDAILLATEWPEYLSLDWSKIRSLMRGRVIFDGRNVLDQKLLTGLGFEYMAFGRSGFAGTNGHMPQPQPVGQVGYTGSLK